MLDDIIQPHLAQYIEKRTTDNRATQSPTKVGAGHPNDVHPPNDVFFPLCIQPPPTSTIQPHHV